MIVWNSISVILLFFKARSTMYVLSIYFGWQGNCLFVLPGRMPYYQRKKDRTKGTLMWPNSSKIITNSFRGVLNFNHHSTQIGILRTKNIYLNDWILTKFFWLNRVVKRSHFFQKYFNELLIFFLKFKKFLITDNRHW